MQWKMRQNRLLKYIYFYFVSLFYMLIFSRHQLTDLNLSKVTLNIREPNTLPTLSSLGRTSAPHFRLSECIPGYRTPHMQSESLRAALQSSSSRCSLCLWCQLPLCFAMPPSAPQPLIRQCWFTPDFGPQESVLTATKATWSCLFVCLFPAFSYLLQHNKPPQNLRGVVILLHMEKDIGFL